MKKITLILVALMSVIFLFTSCQKAKEPEGKKEAQTPKQEVQTQKEVKQQPSETKLEVQPKQQEQAPIATPEVKKEKKEKPIETKPSPLTEEEQKEFEKLKKRWLGPKFTEKDALKALRILLKADLDPTNIRWYSEHPDVESGQDICDMLRLSSRTKKKEAFELTLEVLKEDRGYVTVCAVKEIKFSHDKNAIPYLRRYLSHTSSNEQLTILLRLEAAGSLLVLGDADTALPVLDELAKEGNTYAIPYLFKSGWGKEWKLWDERGLEIIKRALSYPQDQIKAEAALFLSEMEIEKQKAEEVALRIVEKLKDKKREDYGFTIIGGPSNPKWILLPEYEGKNLKELEEYYYADSRACTYSLEALGIIKSKKALPLLNQIKEKYSKTNGWVCWKIDIDKALKKITENEVTK